MAPKKGGTGPGPAKKAGKELGSKKSTPAEKSVAGSDLAQVKGKPSPPKPSRPKPTPPKKRPPKGK